MNNTRIYRKVSLCFLLLLMSGIFFCSRPAPVQAATTGFKTVNGKTYYIDKNGLKHTGWLTLNGKKYYFNSRTGVMVTGWLKNTKGQYRYFNTKTGVMYTGWLKNSAGKYRLFNTSTGIMTTGWLKDKNGKFRYFGASDGYMYTGWYKDKSGKYRYFDPSTGIMVTGYHYSGKNVRRFNTSGYMITGWVKETAGFRYYSKSTGIMVTGFTETNGKTRYFYTVKPSNGLGSYGVMLRGFRTIGGKKYYFNPASTLADVAAGKTGGYMAVSCFKTISGKTYYFQKNGQAKSGWLTLNNDRYYFGTDYVMYANKTATIDGTSYRFDANGVATTLYDQSANGMLNVGTSRTYQIYPAFTNIPGVANGSIDDVTLLAAVADREMGAAGVNGMMGVIMCILNRTLSYNTAFPNTVRYCIYQYPQQFSEGASGSFAVLEKKLKNPGTSAWANEAGARTAARNAIAIFNSYKTNGTPRTIPGYSTTDFDYIGFMTPAALRDAIAYGGANPNRTETFGGICTFYDCWNKQWGNK